MRVELVAAAREEPARRLEEARGRELAAQLNAVADGRAARHEGVEQLQQPTLREPPGRRQCLDNRLEARARCVGVGTAVQKGELLERGKDAPRSRLRVERHRAEHLARSPQQRLATRSIAEQQGAAATGKRGADRRVGGNRGESGLGIRQHGNAPDGHVERGPVRLRPLCARAKGAKERGEGVESSTGHEIGRPLARAGQPGEALLHSLERARLFAAKPGDKVARAEARRVSCR